MERNPLPDRSREEQIDRSSSDASHNNISLRQHMKMFGQRNDQQARTNEAPTSGLDGHGARQIEDVWDKGETSSLPMRRGCTRSSANQHPLVGRPACPKSF